MKTELTKADLEQIAQRGTDPQQVYQQIEWFENPPPFAAIERACTVGDGIVRLEPEAYGPLVAGHEQAAAQGRVLKFVPASGAASRMFKTLLSFLETGEDPTGDGQRLATECDRFPFAGPLRELAGAGADAALLARALLTPDGLNYAALPKGQLAFHQNSDGPRTPFEEHLYEAAHYACDNEGLCRLHMTVTPAHEEGFSALLATRGEVMAARLGVRFEVGFSHQQLATDTLAVDLENRPLRDAQGQLVFRPGGHGALIRNLQQLGGDIVLIKNIDNVMPPSRVETTLLWKKLLGGMLVELQREIFDLLVRLTGPACGDDDCQAAEEFLQQRLGQRFSGDGALPERRRALTRRLDRPMRVCGMVRNDGEPGGGPFWVRGADQKTTCQIVESSQIDPDSATDQAILASATHFNPVDLACGVKDFRGEPFDLSRFVDPATVFISRKSLEGRDLKALELPGLWNGAMAGWNTVFLEVPAETFCPVKTLFDLLRPEHQIRS